MTSLKFSAICADYRKDGFKSREDVEAWIRRVEDAGHCKQEHRIVETPGPDVGCHG